ncbi:larval cuticle protein A2B-like [Photinus pyralis]|uniref:Cuticle protein n=1 Tax=Photinus pyralis TaxID=7054 RepID=A0A1Y1NE04_PHOPY|nr:larval cuticle protein A2B-like [Photinus pyralis]
MAFKVVVFAAFLALARASEIIAPVAPVLAKTVLSAEFDPHPKYSFGYGVSDPLTGDSKSHVESRDGGFVQGRYSLDESDGTQRIVDYTADPINGFNAVVNKVPLAKAIVEAPIAAKTILPVPVAPIAAKTILSAPVAPIAAKTVISAPVARLAHIAGAPAAPLAYGYHGYHPYAAAAYPYSVSGSVYPYGAHLAYNNVVPKIYY